MRQDQNGARGKGLRIAAAGDVHCREDNREEIERVTAELAECRPDLVLLAGDLTTHGEPEQGAVLADACRDLDAPVVAVLGNHDWHVNRHDELVEALSAGGIRVLDREHTILRLRDVDVGVVGVKGFVGGFAGSHLPDFGEPLLRSVYGETSLEVEALDRGFREIALCEVRIGLLHYSPVGETIIGEPPGIWAFLGTDRLAAPIAEHEPDLVLHGHAHAGTFRGSIGRVPVYNVSVPVIERDFWIFELDVSVPTQAPIH